MLNDKDFEHYLSYILEKSQNYAHFVLKTIAHRVNSIKHIKREETLKIDFILDSKKDITSIYDELNIIKSDTKKYLTKTLYDITKRVYADGLVFFEKPISLELNFAVLYIMENYITETEKHINSILESSMILFKDSKSQLPNLHTLENTYNAVINEAITHCGEPEELFNQNMCNTMNQLAASGLRNVGQKSKYSTSIDTMVDTIIGTDFKNLSEDISEELGKQYDADVVMLSAHQMSAPDHEPVQGRIFSIAEYDKMQNGEDMTDIYGNTYIGFPRAIGTWNCRHYPMYCKLSKLDKVYSEKKLQELIDNNKKGVTIGKKHLSLYDCTQLKNSYERKLKEYSRHILIAREMKDVTQLNKFTAKFTQLNREYEYICKLANLTKNKYTI